MQINYKTFSLLFGFTVWLFATLAFRYGSHLFFLPDNPPVLISLFLLVIPVLGFLTFYVFRKYRLSGPERVNSAVLMALPGMILDTLCIQFFETVFPALRPEDGASLGAWLLWVYAVVLIWGLLKKKAEQSLS